LTLEPSCNESNTSPSVSQLTDADTNSSYLRFICSNDG
jgi:hypothetical protein